MKHLNLINNRFIKDKNLLEVLKGSSAAFLLRVAGMVSSYSLIFLISHVYGADVLGIFALCLTLLQVFTVLGKLGVDTAMMRFVSEYSTSGEFIFISRMSKLALNILLPLSSVICILVFFYSREIAEVVFKKGYLTPYFKIAALGIVPNIFIMLNSERLRGLKKIKEYSFLRNVAIPLFAFGILGISSVFISHKVLPVLIYMIVVVITAIISFIFWRKAFTAESGNSNVLSMNQGKSRPDYRKLLGLAIPMLFTTSLLLIMGWTDTIMLGIFKTTADVGIYRVSLRLAAIISITLIAFNAILGPKVTELWEKGKVNELKKVVRQATAIVFVSSMIGFIILVIFRHLILGMFGPEIRSGSTAFIFLLLGQLFNSAVGSVGLILMVTGKQIVIQNVMIAGTIINITLNLLLIPNYGINGAAFASMTSMIFINIIPFIYVKKFMGFYTLSFSMMRVRRRGVKKQ